MTVCLIFKDRKLHKGDAALDRAASKARLSAALKRPKSEGNVGDATLIHASDGQHSSCSA